MVQGRNGPLAAVVGGLWQRVRHLLRIRLLKPGTSHCDLRIISSLSKVTRDKIESHIAADQ